MSNQNWHLIASRLSARHSVDVDEILWPDKKCSKRGGELTRNNIVGNTAPSTVCWPMADSGQTNIGIRVSSPLNHPAATAEAMIAMAIERQITPVILSRIDNSGLEQFGLRIERITGEKQTEQALCEEELKQFYNMAIVLDAENLSTLR